MVLILAMLLSATPDYDAHIAAQRKRYGAGVKELWTTSGLEAGIAQTAGAQANAYAEAELAKGNDYAAAYDRKYREIYDRQLRSQLEALGLMP